MQRTMCVYTHARILILTLAAPSSGGPATPTRPSHHAGHAPSVTACGVERWAVKTGMDPDARLVNQKVVVPTTVAHVRSLPAPASLPSRSRLRPVETTVWAVEGVLMRYKVEVDSNVHLVLADSGGRTMIAEIPAPQSVGAASPFLPAIRSVCPCGVNV